MTISLINISGKLDQPTIELYRTVDEAAKAVGSTYLVVGASARDLLLHHGYGMVVIRATGDTDFGVQVTSWEQFDGIRNWLVSNGYQKTRMQHRLVSPAGLKIDIVPFGGIEREDSTISWPPEGAAVMNVLGFEDALNSAIEVCISEYPELRITIASAAGLALLKTIAWTDRSPDMRAKDAKDLLYLARTFEKLPFVDVYGDEELLERLGFNITLVGAYLLGKDSCKISGDAACDYISNFFRGEMKNRSFDNLIDESLESRFSEREPNELTLKAFHNGYLESR
jgi:predicted nucleotidyltransferase